MTLPTLSATSDCIAACLACADACDQCFAGCLKEDDVAMMARCITLDIDCAAVCRLAVGAMRRDSPLSGPICAMCAEAGDTCADECARHEHEHCQLCAQACRACAASCRAMVSLAPEPER